YREQEYARSGLFEDYFMLTASCVPEDMPEQELDYRGEGYFTYSMSFSLQTTTAAKSGLVTETTFRHGTAADENALYQDRQAQRYDLEAIGMVYESLGFEAPKTALEFLQRPLLLKKSEFPNGILDVLRHCDIATDVLQDVMNPRDIAEYLDLFDRSAARDATLQDVRTGIRQELLAAAGTFAMPEDANRLLWELVRDHAVKDAVSNEAIDAIAFGPLAAVHLSKAREAHATGDTAGRDEWMGAALEVATTSGCGGGSCGLSEIDPTSKEGMLVGQLLDMKPGDAMVRDDERPCRNCGTTGTVYYVSNASKVNKCCISCKAVEKDGKRQDQDDTTQLS
ncbi:MAG TPA: hypothetical protein VLF43_02190, partial [Candidatus Saccharimonadales bacterium]|nr:hypothetical protein [Candidatus Saccharimonadales bacterium]